MDDSAHRLLISARRPKGVAAHTRLGRIIGKMDRVTVAYRLWIEAGESHGLTGWGELRLESADGLLWCRVVGEVFRPSPVEYGFHSFWLTRRGMILVVTNLLEERAPASAVAPGNLYPTHSTFRPAVQSRSRALAEAQKGVIDGARRSPRMPPSFIPKSAFRISHSERSSALLLTI